MQLSLKPCQTHVESDAVFSIICYKNDNDITDQILHTSVCPRRSSHCHMDASLSPPRSQ